MILLIGSVARNYVLANEPYLAPKDFDFVAHHEDAKKLFSKNKDLFRSILPNLGATKLTGMPKRSHGHPWEIELAWPNSTAAKLLELVEGDPETKYGMPLGDDIAIPSLDVLYTLKMSHRYLRNSPHFHKTMWGIKNMRTLGAKVPDRYKEWLKEREKATYSYSHPNLNQDKKNFFSGDGIEYKFDHDSVHLAMAVYAGVPAYTHFQKEGSQVAVDRQKWDKLPYAIQLNSVYEESCVLAIERSQVPFPGLKTPAESFSMALEKVCTSITSGWWREFAWENHGQAMDLYLELNRDGDTYVDRFWKGVETGLVKRLA